MSPDEASHHLQNFTATRCERAFRKLTEGHAGLVYPTALRVVAGVLASSTSFFLWSNFFVWIGSLYEHNVAGLAKCYWLALPYYGRDLLSTTIVATVLFGLPALAAKLTETMQATRNGQVLQ